jgi:glycosyltransferase involved in cell wall biosynthesis
LIDLKNSVLSEASAMYRLAGSLQMASTRRDPPAAIAFDVTRLFLGPLSRSPRGIDRIDLALAHHLFNDPSSGHVGILPTPWGMRVYNADRVRRCLAHLDTLWSESVTDETDPQWRGLSAWLQGGHRPALLRAPNAGTLRKARRLANELRSTGFSFGKGVRAALPRGAAYLNVGQIGLAVPWFHTWLSARPDVASVVMLHDVIPLEHPELVDPPSHKPHQQMVRTAAATAHGLIVTTEATHLRIAAEFTRHRQSDVPTLVRGLPLPRAFTQLRAADPALAGERYFVVCGSIEPRKNHALLFRTWRRLIAEFGEASPRLVLVGAHGWEADTILKPLTHDAALASRILHVGGLSSPALARLMLGAAGVLCPSHAEGFGLPLLEANALGVPTIASDIASHREIADARTVLLGCGDVAGWADAITACDAGGERRTPAIARERTEQAYCLDILAFVADCARGRTAP